MKTINERYLCPCGGTTWHDPRFGLARCDVCGKVIEEDKEMVKCPVCEGNPRRWLSYKECMRDGFQYGAYEDCPNCEDGYVEDDEEEE